MDTAKIWFNYNPKTYQQNPRCLPVDTILAGKYLVGPVLGQGGFGITYQGYDLNMETRVAIKEYFPVELVSRDTTSMTRDRVLSLSGDKSITYQQGLKKYVAEAQNVSQFSETPGVVSVKDFFYENETAYIVMEYIEGQSLKDYLKAKGGKLSEGETLSILRPVLDALVKIHSAGIIHRDLSPDNIMLTFQTAEGQALGKNPQKSKMETSALSTKKTGQIQEVKLIDFGAARMTAKKDQKSLTIILKHGYAPEEQYRTHGEQGPWTDVYAICSVMYRMLTGETPVPAMDRMFQDSLRPFEDFGIKVSKPTADAILKGLAVKKENRIQTMQELIQALYEGKAIKHAGNFQNTKTSRMAIAAAAAAVAIGGVSLFLVASHSGIPNRAAAQESLYTADGQNGSHEASDIENGQEALPAAAQETLVLEEEEEDFGEVIVTRKPQTSYARSKTHVVILKEDGTVASVGSNQYGQRNLSEWTRIAAVAAGDTFSAGLRENGTVVIEGTLRGKEEVERWENIVELAGSDYHLYGLTKDGTVVANQVSEITAGLLEWRGIKTITAGPYVFCALTEDGRVLSTGLDHTPADITGWEDVAFLAANQSAVVGVKADGSIRSGFIWKDYRNYSEYGEQSSAARELHGIDEFRNIKQIYMGINGCYGVSEDGTLYLAGPVTKLSGEEGALLSELRSWSDLDGIIGNEFGTRLVGIRKDGSLLKTAEIYKNADPESMTNLKKVIYLDGLGDRSSSLIGITEDDRILYQSFSYAMQYFTEYDSVRDIGEIEYFTDIQNLSEGYAYFDGRGNLWMQDYLNGNGEMVTVNSELLLDVSFLRGNAETETYYAAGLTADHRIKLYFKTAMEPPDALYEAESWTDIRQAAVYCGHSVDSSAIAGLKNDGTVLLAASDETMEADVSGWTDIVSLWQGSHALGAIRKDGTAVFVEDSPEYNQGQYNTHDWTDLTQLALGLYHTAGLRSDGTVYAAGRNDAGQCEVSGWTDIVSVTAGENCTIGLKSDGTLVIAGEIGW